MHHHAFIRTIPLSSGIGQTLQQLLVHHDDLPLHPSTQQLAEGYRGAHDPSGACGESNNREGERRDSVSRMNFIAES